MSQFPPPVIKGSFRKNEKRETDKQPSLLGSVTVLEDIRAGTKLWFAAWGPNAGDDGTSYYLFNGQKKQEQGERARPAPKRSADLPEDEIPF